MGKTERADLANALKRAKTKAIIDNRMTDFGEMLAQFMSKTGYTCKTLAAISNMSEWTIRRMKHNSEYQPTKEMIIAVCVAMKLNVYESRALLKKSPFKLREESPVDALYLKMLEYEGEYSVNEWNMVLSDIGEKAIGCS